MPHRPVCCDLLGTCPWSWPSIGLHGEGLLSKHGMNLNNICQHLTGLPGARIGPQKRVLHVFTVKQPRPACTNRPNARASMHSWRSAPVSTNLSTDRFFPLSDRLHMFTWRRPRIEVVRSLGPVRVTANPRYCQYMLDLFN